MIKIICLLSTLFFFSFTRYKLIMKSLFVLLAIVAVALSQGKQTHFGRGGNTVIGVQSSRLTMYSRKGFWLGLGVGIRIGVCLGLGIGSGVVLG